MLPYQISMDLKCHFVKGKGLKRPFVLKDTNALIKVPLRFKYLLLEMSKIE